MEGLSWKCLALLVIALCHIIAAAPAIDTAESSLDINPLTLDDNNADELDRGKRKLIDPASSFAAKNAILGYVFGKIDSILDAKTRLISSFDATNIAKNKQYGIEAPVPINSLQSLISAVISPKLAAVSAKLGALSGGSASGGFGLGGGAAASSGGAPGSSDDGASAGTGNLLTSFLRLSGPILSSSSGSALGGGNAATSIDDDDDSDE